MQYLNFLLSHCSRLEPGTPGGILLPPWIALDSTGAALHAAHPGTSVLGGSEISQGGEGEETGYVEEKENPSYSPSSAPSGLWLMRPSLQ